MPYKLKINFPATHTGQLLSIPGLGTFKNGSTYTISDDEAQAFRDYQVSNNMPDRTLLQAFDKNEYVTVETAEEEKKSDKKKEDDK